LNPTDRIAQARNDAGLSVGELAENLGVDVTTVRNWEAGRRQLTLDKLIQTAQVLGVSVTYLLGLDERINHAVPVEATTLSLLHYTPVWTVSRGWALVNAVKKSLVFADQSSVEFKTLQEPVYTVPPAFAQSLRGIGAPLRMDEVLSRERVWVEPVTSDENLGAELRGWYHLRGRRLVENEYGNRFYLDTYGAKWLAFTNSV
jgi:transcriptional regulator with XRE-family HTH domain